MRSKELKGEVIWSQTNKQKSYKTEFIYYKVMCFGKLIKNELFKVYPYFYKIRYTIDNF